jgi:dTDP-4-dehydrorhamnose 3,5-epimerase
MKRSPTPLAGLEIVETSPVRDERGRFVRVFCDAELAPLHPMLRIAQVNLSLTARRGTVRGMHFQRPPAAEAKLIRCVRGRVFDVAVDIRRGSPTFLQWHAVELDADRDRQIFIPEGFAHGFQALTDDAELLYLHTRPWSREHEDGLQPQDPRLAIDWPLPVVGLSARDRGAPRLDDGFAGVTA